ncbi:MAG: SGNH/GDSL hydrolase family protein [Candidatus Omnitrophica bacterium]|nr:SGNH/GDSL hydrolase family protein [Candidatus Omnitrophota bacterium]
MTIRGLCFYINLLGLATAAAVISPLYRHTSLQPVALGYSLPLLVGLGLVTLVGLIVFIAILTQGPVFNRRLCVGMVAAAGLLEAGARLLPGGPSAIEDTGRWPKPYVMFGGKPHTAQFNGQGFRIAGPVPQEKAPGELRVMVIGASAVLYGSTVAQTIPGVLEQLWHEAGARQARVYNVGVVSYVSGQELALLLHTIVDYHPDLVIVYDGGNDLYLPMVADPRPGYPFNYLMTEAGLAQVAGRTSGVQAWTSLWYRSRFLQRLLGHQIADSVASLGRLRRESGYQTPAWEEAIVVAYLTNVEKMCRLARAYDFKLAVFLQPMLYTKTPVGKEQQIALGAASVSQYMQRQYDRARAGLQDLNAGFAAEGRCHCVDLSQALTAYDRPTFHDVIHTDDAGNAFMARQIAAALAQRGWLGTRSQAALDNTRQVR